LEIVFTEKFLHFIPSGADSVPPIYGLVAYFGTQRIAHPLRRAGFGQTETAKSSRHSRRERGDIAAD
jgi:hypothetical protein